MSQSPSKFDALRPWNGEQSRAFEEISYQLLKDRVPHGTRATRTGNPDGGVEWYATLPGGTEWGWQAKHVRGIDALLTAMTDSVRRVVKERPDLRKLTFIISWNLSTGTSGTAGRARKSQRQKYEDKKKAWRRMPGAARIEFELLQESDLLDELAKPEHNGRRWFWWNELVLGSDWLRRRLDEQTSAAGEKYRPDLQVDVPIQEDLLALGFDDSTVAEFHCLRRGILSAATDVRLSFKSDDPAATLYQSIEKGAVALKDSLKDFEPRPESPVALSALAAQLSDCVEAIDAAVDHERRREAEERERSRSDPKKADRPPETARSYGVSAFRDELETLRSWLESWVGQSMGSRFYFLTGQAGSGKTHLFLDAAERALSVNRPAVFLPGAQFGRADLWSGIADQLGLMNVGADVLLGAMDTAGEAAGASSRRFVIFIDALNETTPSDFWRVQLPRLRAAIEPFAHVALAVSCRDTYVDLVLDGDEAAHYIRRAHPGFAEREVEATQKYFSHYRLEAPKIPLLTPEFTVPLFLRLYCESMSSPEAAPIRPGHQGRVAIFERYLETKLGSVARRLQPGALSQFEHASAKRRVRAVLDALLDEMSRRGSESLRAGVAEALARGALEDPTEAPRVLGLLQDEGVLTRERLHFNDGPEEGVRIVFQAFADYLLLRRALGRSADPLHDPGVKSWLSGDCSWGITEAATVLVPEQYGVELPDLLDVKAPPAAHDWGNDEAGWKQHNRARQLYRSLVEMLPYRDSKAISKRTIDLLNDAQTHLSREEFYSVLFTIAPQPNNPLNANGLHRYLTQRRMPRRDSDFGFSTYHALSEPSSPAARLARWAAAGPYPDYDAAVVELASIPLCWLLSSPNRFMRDWVTKALVQLLRGHLDVTRKLVERFWTVDDPYVVQRVVVIAHGTLLRSTPPQTTHAKILAEAVCDRVFTAPVRPDELLLDAARGIVRWAVAGGHLPSAALVRSQRPYGLKPPGRPPSEAVTEAKYGWRDGRWVDEGYSTIYSSVLSMGDFGRYVVESGLHHFSRYRIGEDYPERNGQSIRLNKRRWEKFVRSLDTEQQKKLAEALHAAKQGRVSPIESLLALTDAQRELWYGVYERPKPIIEEYPARDARRWVFHRTLRLGWTPALFGERDRAHEYGRYGREEHKAERWGKKYQWMAYHELLARVADNYQASRLYNDREPYVGLHQITGDREIDPSLPPIDFRAFSERGGIEATPWQAPPIALRSWPPGRLDFKPYHGDFERFLADTGSGPTLVGDLFLLDADGGTWVVLDGHTTHVDPRAEKGWRGLRQSSAIDTVLMPKGEARRLLRTLQGGERRRARDLLDTHGHVDCCYVGEVGRAVGPTCGNRHKGLEPTSPEQHGAVRLVSPLEKYTWEGSLLDCSIGESAHLVLPSTFVQKAMALTFDDRGPCWTDPTGAPVFVYYWQPGNSSRAFLVKAEFLGAFIRTQRLELVILHWFERMLLSGDIPRETRQLESMNEAWLSQDLRVHGRRPWRKIWGTNTRVAARGELKGHAAPRSPSPGTGTPRAKTRKHPRR